MVKFIKDKNYILSFKNGSSKRGSSKSDGIPVYICDIDHEYICLNLLEQKGQPYISSDFILELTPTGKIEQRGVTLTRFI
jgi:hypothetical protein